MPNPKLSEGDRAPAFTAKTDGGGRLALKDLKGRRVLLYFYPRDMTPGCTGEACDFRDAQAALEAKGVVVVGVSPDSAESHDRFKAKHDLPFPLLADEKKEIAGKYGVYREKTSYGRTSVGIVRSTFLIDADGRIEKVYDNVRAKGHVGRVLKDL